MKKVYFEMLDFEAIIPDSYSFIDKGYTPSLMDRAKDWLKEMGCDPTEKALADMGFQMETLRYNSGGIFIGTKTPDGRKASTIFYNHLAPEADDIYNRAHEETHAAEYLDLREDLENMMGTSGLEQLCEEDFCDQAGFYVLKRKGIEIPELLKIPYEKRLLIISNSRS
jgi:hypothetical protein